MKIVLCQISNRVINPRKSVNSPAEFMYDAQWRAKESYGYWKPEDFWELPLWIGEVTYACKSVEYFDVDLHIVTHRHEALPDDADAYCFSALEVNKELIYRHAQARPNMPFYVGGYIDPTYFETLPNVHWCNTVESLCERLAIPYRYGVDWSLFTGERCIPRLTMSYGCSHHCTFCTVPNKVTEVPYTQIEQQVDAMACLKFKLVYLNDKTWGMCENRYSLDGVYNRIKAFNPEFEGFIIQTSVAMVQSLENRTYDELSFMWRAHIKVIELGIETFNDDLLRRYCKPQREKSMTHVVQMLSERGFRVVANIMLGLPGEDIFTYYRTLGWLALHYKYLFGVNIYTLAVYSGSDLAKEIAIDDGDNRDTNELAEDRTFWTDAERVNYLHMKDKFYVLGAEIWYQRRLNVPTVEQ